MTGNEHTGSEQFTQTLRTHLATRDAQRARFTGRLNQAATEEFLAVAAEQARMWADAYAATWKDTAAAIDHSWKKLAAERDTLRASLNEAETARNALEDELTETQAAAQLLRDELALCRAEDPVAAKVRERHTPAAPPLPRRRPASPAGGRKAGRSTARTEPQGDAK